MKEYHLKKEESSFIKVKDNTEILILIFKNKSNEHLLIEIKKDNEKWSINSNSSVALSKNKIIKIIKDNLHENINSKELKKIKVLNLGEDSEYPFYTYFEFKIKKSLEPKFIYLTLCMLHENINIMKNVKNINKIIELSSLIMEENSIKLTSKFKEMIESYKSLDNNDFFILLELNYKI